MERADVSAPLRVLFLTDSLSDLDGVGRYAVELIRALEALEPGLGVRVLLARKHRPTSSAVPPHWRVDVALPPDYFLNMSRARFWPALAAASWRVWRAARGADLVHAIKDYPHSLAGVLGAHAAGVPCVATAHGTYSVQPLLEGRHRRLARWAWRHYAAVIAVSGYTARRLAEALGPEYHPERMHVVPNAVAAAPATEPLALDGPRPWHGVPFTLGIGELKERKGHHLAVAAWAQVARARPALHHFVVGKRSDEAYLRELVELAQREGVAERLHFLGNVSEAEKHDLLQRALLFLHTPVTATGGGFEGFGLVYLEAAAAGTPSIGTLESGAEDAVADGVSGVLVAPRVEAVAAALARLLGDDALRARLAAGARAHAAGQGWEANARRVLALYRAVLARQAP
jgi:glycosyltransferase involved in cell wall biosynthesis